MATVKEAKRLLHQLDTLRNLGFTEDEAHKLRRISMTLRRWFEQECGNSNERYSWAIERNEESGKPFHVRYLNNGGVRVAHPIPDREAGARKRLDAIMTHRNKRNVLAKDGASDSLSYYIQTDPRGAALYILRPCDVPDGGDPSAYYSRGICVY